MSTRKAKKSKSATVARTPLGIEIYQPTRFDAVCKYTVGSVIAAGAAFVAVNLSATGASAEEVDTTASYMEVPFVDTEVPPVDPTVTTNEDSSYQADSGIGTAVAAISDVDTISTAPSVPPAQDEVTTEQLAFVQPVAQPDLALLQSDPFLVPANAALPADPLMPGLAAVLASAETAIPGAVSTFDSSYDVSGGSSAGGGSEAVSGSNVSTGGSSSSVALDGSEQSPVGEPQDGVAFVPPETPPGPDDEVPAPVGPGYGGVGPQFVMPQTLDPDVVAGVAVASADLGTGSLAGAKVDPIASLASGTTVDPFAGQGYAQFGAGIDGNLITIVSAGNSTLAGATTLAPADPVGSVPPPRAPGPEDQEPVSPAVPSKPPAPAADASSDTMRKPSQVGSASAAPGSVYGGVDWAVGPFGVARGQIPIEFQNIGDSGVNVTVTPGAAAQLSSGLVSPSLAATVETSGGTRVTAATGGVFPEAGVNSYLFDNKNGVSASEKVSDNLRIGADIDAKGALTPFAELKLGPSTWLKGGISTATGAPDVELEHNDILATYKDGRLTVGAYLDRRGPAPREGSPYEGSVGAAMTYDGFDGIFAPTFQGDFRIFGDRPESPKRVPRSLQSPLAQPPAR